jgi:hypothetical protein
MADVLNLALHFGLIFIGLPAADQGLPKSGPSG